LGIKTHGEFIRTRDVVSFIVVMIDNSQDLAPEMRAMNSLEMFEKFRERMDIWGAALLRQLTVDIIYYIMKEYANSNSETTELIKQINTFLIPNWD
jgi:hypothetical protein